MAEMLRIRIGAPLAHIEHATYDQTVSATRELLGQDAFTTLWAQGRATPLAEIDTIGTATQESSDECLQTATEVQSGPMTHSTHKNILSSREAEVLQLMAAGLSNKEIGERLFITVHTAKYHVTSILNKLGADTRTQAVVQALQHGLL
jgi:DNA-binding NarL/FixJ family response regulator